MIKNLASVALKMNFRNLLRAGGEPGSHGTWIHPGLESQTGVSVALKKELLPSKYFFLIHVTRLKALLVYNYMIESRTLCGALHGGVLTEVDDQLCQGVSC